jgi:hypothetical protein
LAPSLDGVVVIHYIHHRDDFRRCKQEEKNVGRFEKAAPKGFSFLLHVSHAKEPLFDSRTINFCFFIQKIQIFINI